MIEELWAEMRECVVNGIDERLMLDLKRMYLTGVMKGLCLAAKTDTKQLCVELHEWAEADQKLLEKL